MIRVVLGGEKATVAMQDIRRIRIFIVITPLMFFEVSETIMFVRAKQNSKVERVGMGQCQRCSPRRAVSIKRLSKVKRSLYHTELYTYVP